MSFQPQAKPIALHMITNMNALMEHAFASGALAASLDPEVAENEPMALFGNYRAEEHKANASMLMYISDAGLKRARQRFKTPEPSQVQIRACCEPMTLAFARNLFYAFRSGAAARLAGLSGDPEALWISYDPNQKGHYRDMTCYLVEAALGWNGMEAVTPEDVAKFIAETMSAEDDLRAEP